MNRDNNQEQLTEGYESALESFMDMEAAVSELQDIVADTLSDLQGDIRILISTMKECLRVLHHQQSDRMV